MPEDRSRSPYRGGAPSASSAVPQDSPGFRAFLNSKGIYPLSTSVQQESCGSNKQGASSSSSSSSANHHWNNNQNWNGQNQNWSNQYDGIGNWSNATWNESNYVQPARQAHKSQPSSGKQPLQPSAGSGSGSASSSSAPKWAQKKNNYEILREETTMAADSLKVDMPLSSPREEVPPMPVSNHFAAAGGQLQSPAAEKPTLPAELLDNAELVKEMLKSIEENGGVKNWRELLHKKKVLKKLVESADQFLESDDEADMDHEEGLDQDSEGELSEEGEDEMDSNIVGRPQQGEPGFNNWLRPKLQTALQKFDREEQQKKAPGGRNAVKPLLKHQFLVKHLFENNFCRRLLVDHATYNWSY
ncbi:unnamed protein product [Amoebophrya sp. A120]|nr:unnamed protein product [Amoebophrya sp. A120]|eukprot:GSA120T00010187001.1